MKVKATHYICIKEPVKAAAKGDKPETTKPGKDLLVIRRGEERTVNKQELSLLERAASGKFEKIEES